MQKGMLTSESEKHRIQHTELISAVVHYSTETRRGVQCPGLDAEREWLSETAVADWWVNWNRARCWESPAGRLLWRWPS